MDELQKSIKYARELHQQNPQGFEELLVQVKAFEPAMLEFMELALNAPAPTPLDTQTVEELESLSVELDNASSRLRQLMRDGKVSMALALILEHLKASSRHLTDAADDLLRLTSGGV